MRALVILAVLTSWPGAQDKKVPGRAHPKVDQAKVDAAIDDGVKMLRGQMTEIERAFTHAWEQGAPAQNYLELVLYTWVHAGVDENDPDFKRMLDKVLAKKLTSTYQTCVQAMLLQKLDPAKYQWRIAQCAQFIVDNQCENGQWCYGHETDVTEFPQPKEQPKIETAGGAKKGDTNKPAKGGTTVSKRVPVKKKKKGCPAGDNSNSQYAALGIRACIEAGIVIPRDVLVKAKEWWEKQQQSDGGWMYDGQGGPVVPPGATPGTTYGSMTLGGIGALCIYKYYLKENYKQDPHVIKGMNWFTNKFTVKENPGYKEWHYYTLYALERAGDLFGTEFFGKNEWYPIGANWLLENQMSGGGWKGEGQENDIAATCFAILFLRRATRPLKISTGK